MYHFISALKQTELLEILHTDWMKYKNKHLLDGGWWEKGEKEEGKLCEIEGVVSYCSVNGE